MSTNRSLWQDKLGVPGVIRESPVPTTVADTELLVKVHAWAMNPADAIIQDNFLPFVTYPVILGDDISGTVFLAGSDSIFKSGDRILAFAIGSLSHKPGRGGFQDYVVVDQSLACKIPESLSFAEAVVFPLAITSPASGLFKKDYLGLPFPKLEPIATGKSILIWGGSSAVGSNAIQLSKAAGFDVVTTCSVKNFEYVQGLGATKAFDYNAPCVVDDIVAELEKGTCAGIFHAVGDVLLSCQVSHQYRAKLLVASSNPIPPGIPDGVEAKMVFGTGGAEMFNDILPATFGGFLPDALAKGVYKVAPEPMVVSTKGVDGIQEALDVLKKGVSAKKVVVVVE